MREELAYTQTDAWARIATPGTWLRGAERVAIAAETRHARACPLCAARRAAAMPMSVVGTHAALGALDDQDVEAVHRIATDSGRLGRTWFSRVSAGRPEARYIELVSIVVITTAIDTFRAAAGLAPLPLPEPLPGEPGRRLPAGARPGPGWTATLRPDDVGPDDPDLYRARPGPAERSGAHILLALSLVPHSMIHWWDLFEPMYLRGPEMRDFGHEFRAITHPQMEMLAARVAALNQCEY